MICIYIQDISNNGLAEIFILNKEGYAAENCLARL
jgi:hypothetical protein